MTAKDATGCRWKQVGGVIEEGGVTRVGVGRNLHAGRHAIRELVAGVDLLEEHVRVTFSADGKGHKAAKEW